MILWIGLFVLVLAISFVLALKSMKDYQEIPIFSREDFSLFLIRNYQGLNEQMLSMLYEDLIQSGLNISFERLFKGKESAIVIFGSSQILRKYKDTLNLLELEDYTNIELGNISSWEMGFKEGGEALFTKIPELKDSEQIWWQLLLWVNKDKVNSFQSHIRVAVISNDKYRRKELAQGLQKISPEYLYKLPKAFSDTQIIDFYKKRSFPSRSKNKSLTSSQILKLITFT